jgi:hypothetical protein
MMADEKLFAAKLATMDAVKKRCCPILLPLTLQIDWNESMQAGRCSAVAGL